MLAAQAPDHAAPRRLGLEQFDRLVERKARRVGPPGNGGVDLAVIDVGAEPAGLHANLAPFRMLAKFSPCAAAEAGAAGATLLGDDEVDRPIPPDLEHVVVTT